MVTNNRIHHLTVLTDILDDEVLLVAIVVVLELNDTVGLLPPMRDEWAHSQLLW